MVDSIRNSCGPVRRRRTPHGNPRGFSVRDGSAHLAVTLLLAFCATPSYASLDDRINALIQDVAQTPTNVDNASGRAQVLWEWTNSYALTGSYLPVNLTQTISSILAYPGTRPAQFRFLDHYVREMALKRDDPLALGSLTATGGPFVAGEYGTLIQTMTVGTKDIEVGGGLLIARHFMPNYGLYQTTDPDKPNYVSISSTNGAVRFAPASAPMSGMHGGFRDSNPALYFELQAGAMTQGDQVTVTYGDTSAGGPGLLMPTMSSDFIPFPIYVAFDSSRAFHSLPIQPVVVQGQESVEYVTLFAPSISAAGDKVELTVRASDAFFNRPTGEVPPWKISLNEQVVAELPASSSAVQRFVLDSPLPAGVYYPTVSGGGLTGEGNPILIQEDPKLRIYWGDTHGHSGFAEGVGTPDRFMQWAKEDAALDFVTHSEHDIWMDDYEWQVLKDNVKTYSDQSFIAYLGYEWTIQNIQGGHHNVLFRDVEDRVRIPAQTHGTLSKLYQGLRNHHDPTDVVVIPHAHQPGNYRMSDPELQPLVEIMSQHGTFEWFGIMYLQHGHQVGFIAASDNHLSQPGFTAPRGASLAQRGGLAAIRAKEKSRDSIFDGMKNLAAYATTADRIILDFELNGVPMGQRTAFDTDRSIEARAIGTAPIANVAVIKNGKVLYERDYDTSTDQSLDGLYQIAFKSESEPFHANDNPRGWRHWRGNLKVEGARLNAIKGADMTNPTTEQIDQSEGSVQFSTATRGDSSSLLLDLTDVQQEFELNIQLDATRETGGGPPKMRRHQPVQAHTFTLSNASLEKWLNVPAGDYVDRVRLRKVIRDGQRDISISLTDTGNKQGDYYYVRVKQFNDAIAWSSPIWVGGFPSR